MSYYPTPAPTPAKQKPSIAGIVVAIVLAILGPVMGTIVIVVSTMNATSAITHAGTYASDGTPVQIDLVQGTETGLWLKGSQLERCQVTDPSGAVVPLSDPGLVNQSANGFELVATFTPSASGTYVVACTTTGASSFKIAPMMKVGGMVAGIVVGALLIVVFFFGGIVVLIVTVVRRARWNSRYGPGAPVYPYPPGQYPGQPAPYAGPSYDPPR